MSPNYISDEFNAVAILNIWANESKCMNGVHKLAYYGSYDLPITTQIGKDEKVRYFFTRDDAIYLIGIGEQNTQPICNKVDKCIFKVTGNDLTVSLQYENNLLFSKNITVSEPIYIPIIGEKP